MQSLDDYFEKSFELLKKTKYILMNILLDLGIKWIQKKFGNLMEDHLDKICFSCYN